MLNWIQNKAILILSILLVTSVLALAGTGKLLKDSWKENAILSGQVTSLKTDLDKKDKHRESVNSTLDELISESQTLEDQFSLLEKEVNKCPKPILITGPTNETQPKELASAVKSELAASKLFLDRATCLANSDCSPPESSSEALQDDPSR